MPPNAQNKISSYFSISYTHITYCIFSLFILLYLASRVLYLDADVPQWLQSYMYPMDEMSYSATAVQAVHKYNSDVAPYQAMSPSTPFHDFSFTLHYVTDWTLRLFGNNYYGFRMPSVIMGLIIFSVMFNLLARRFGLIYAIAGCALLLCDYQFLLHNRVVDSTIHRMAGFWFLIFCFDRKFSSKDATPMYSLFLGCMTSFIAMYIYLTNFFILPAAIIVAILTFDKDRLRHLKYFSLGIIIVALPRIYSIFFDPFFFKLMPHIVARVATPDNSGSWSSLMAKMRWNILWSNAGIFLTYNWYLCPLFFKCILYFMARKIWDVVTNKLTACLYIVILITGAYICSDVLTEKEGVIAVTLCLFIPLAYFLFFLVRNWKRLFEIQRKLPIDTAVFVMYLFFFLQTIFTNDSPHKKLIFLLPIFIYFILWGTHDVLRILHGLSSLAYLLRNHLSVLATILMFSSGIEDAALVSYERIYKQPSYKLKNAMISLNTYKNEVFLGGWSHVFVLYNSIEPLFNYYWNMHTSPELYDSRMIEFGEKFYPRSVTIYETNEEGIERMKKLGYHLEKIIWKSNDQPYYPDYALYRYGRTEPTQRKF